MYDGTLYGHWQAIVTFQQMIVLCDAEGVVDMTPQAMAARTSIPLEIIQKGLEILEQPDPYTRTPGEDGKRITLLDAHRPWGWRIVNHKAYRDIVAIEDKRKADRERIAAKRAESDKSQPVAESREPSQVSQTVANVAHADADTNAGKSKTRARRAPTKSTPLTECPEGTWLTEDMRRSALSRYPDCDTDAAFAQFLASHRSKGSKFKDWPQAWETWIGNFDRFGYPKRRAANGSEMPIGLPLTGWR